MAIARHQLTADPLAAGAARIEVHVERPRIGAYSAIVVLHGEHDLATNEAVRVSLAPLYGNVLVDLTECYFIDSTSISILLRKAEELRRDGHELELRVVPDSIVARALSIIGVAQFVAVRDAARPGLAGTSSAERESR